MYKLLTFAISIGAVFGQSLTQVLNNTPDLSNFTNYLSLTNLENRLDGLSNITILAPTNAAFSEFLNSSEGSVLTSTDQASMQKAMALLNYHVLNGTYSDFNDNEIIHTMLTAPEFANVTGGQVIHAFDKRKHHQDIFISGLLATAVNTTRFMNVRVLSPFGSVLLGCLDLHDLLSLWIRACLRSSPLFHCGTCRQQHH